MLGLGSSAHRHVGQLPLALEDASGHALVEAVLVGGRVRSKGCSQGKEARGRAHGRTLADGFGCGFAELGCGLAERGYGSPRRGRRWRGWTQEARAVVVTAAGMDEAVLAAVLAAEVS